MKSTVAVCVFVLLIYVKTVEPKNASKEQKQPLSKNTTEIASAPSTTTRRPFLNGERLPCSCAEGQCGCCTGYILDRFNQKACLNLTYEPDDFAVTAAMSLNNRVLYRNTFSGKNPPPMCIQIPRLQFIRFCMRFSNIYFAGRNIHLCVDMNANWDQISLVHWSFDCIRMGASGFAIVGPEDGGGIPVNPVDAVGQTDEDYDDSARDIPIPSDNSTVDVIKKGSILIFNSNIRNIAAKIPDRSLVSVKKLANGDYLVSSKKSSKRDRLHR